MSTEEKEKPQKRQKKERQKRRKKEEEKKEGRRKRKKEEEEGRGRSPERSRSKNQLFFRVHVTQPHHQLFFFIDSLSFFSFFNCEISLCARSLPGSFFIVLRRTVVVEANHLSFRPKGILGLALRVVAACRVKRA